MSQIKYSTERHEHYVLLSLDEEKLTTSNAPQLKSEFVTLHAEGRPAVILNLDKVGYVDSSGLSAILVGKRIWAASEGLFVICNLSENVKKLITITQLDSTLNIAQNVEEAKKMVLLHVVQSEDEGDEGDDSEEETD